MKEEGQITSINSSEKTAAAASERTVSMPHFDAAAIENARPAVPLSEVKRERSWPTGMLLALAIVGGLAGGLLGGSLTGFFLKENAAQSSTSGRDAKAADETADIVPTPAQPASQQPAPAAATTSAAPTGERSSVDASAVAAPGERAQASVTVPKETETALRGALNEWVAATNARDIDRQMSFYNPVVDAFYRMRNASREDVRADKARVFARASSIDVRADEPEIRLSPDGRTAVMRFNKRYAIAGGGEDRRGEVLQELRWQWTNGAWRISSERDLRVVN
jgi:predicted lipid-binding transport protein (Tim44 family)